MTKKAISIATAMLCISSMIPVPGFCQEPSDTIAKEFVKTAEGGDAAQIEDEFDLLAETIEDSDDPINDTREVLENLVAEVNTHTGQSMTMDQAVGLAKKSLHLFQLSAENQEICLKAFEFLLAKDVATQNAIKNDIKTIYAKYHHQFGSHHHHGKHHKIPWKLVVIIVSAITTASVASIAAPAAAPAIFGGAATIIQAVINH